MKEIPVSESRIYRGALLAPLSSPIAATLLAPLIERDITFASAPLIFAVCLPIAYLAVLAIGLPAMFLLRRRGWLHVLPALATGGLVGIGLSLLLGAVFAHEASANDQWAMAFYFAGVSLFTVLGWCLIARVPFRP